MLPPVNTATAALISTAVRRDVRGGSRIFYVRMAYAFAFVAIAGFVPTYWAPVAAGTFGGAPILHVHGLLFTAWTLLFVAQARLASAGRFERHRMLGLAGISVATAMLIVGLMVSIHSMESAAGMPYEGRVRAFAIVPVTIILFFAATVAAAIANARRPDVHMRLMVVSSVTVLPPAIARVVFLLLAPAGAPRPGLGEPPPVGMTLIPGFAADLFLAAAILHDWRSRGRPHPVYLVAGALLVTLQVVRVPLSGTAAWHAVAGWLLRLAG